MHINVAVLIPTHHGPEVKYVDFIDSTTRLFPSKEDCPVLVHHGEGEGTTGRRSLSSELRGRPDTCKWGWGNLENGTMLHHPYNIESEHGFLCE